MELSQHILYRMEKKCQISKCIAFGSNLKKKVSKEVVVHRGGKKFLKHAMKMVKRILKRRILTLKNSDSMQFGFMPL